MRKLYCLIIVFCGALFSEQVFAQCDNLKPMFGDNCNKTAALKKADNKFIKSELKRYGSADSAANVYIAIAWSNFYRDDPETAMKRFNQAWLLNSNNPGVYFGFGHLTRYAFKKDAAEAEKYYKIGREHDAKHTEEPMSWLMMLNLAETRNDLNNAIDISSQLIQSFPEFGKGFGYKKRAYYYVRAQLFPNAIEDSNKAIEIDPKDPNSYVSRGFAYFWRNDDEKALADYNQALEISPNFEPAYSSRALLYSEHMNQPDLALADVEKAMQLEPKELQYYKLKSDILFKQNRKTEACACLKNGMAAGNKDLQEDYREKCAK